MKHRSLPAWTYFDPEFFALERERLFLGNWQLVCHASDIPEPGDYFTFDLLGERVFVIRMRSGEIGAFHNVCRHRAARLLDGPQGHCRGRICCPYHAWTYGLDGSLKSTGAPGSGNYALECSGLEPVELDEFAGFVFVRIKPSPVPSVAAQFAPIREHIERYRFEDMRALGRVTLRPRAVNWKQIADNYVDALHIPVAHPGLFALLGNSYALAVQGRVHIMTGCIDDGQSGAPPRNGKSFWSNDAYRRLLPDAGHLAKDQRRHWVYYRLWPNLAFDLYPDQIDFMQFIPVSASETLIREIPYGLPNARRETHLARYLNWRINRVVNAEDTMLINRVHEGMASSSFSSGPLADTEVCLIDSAERIRKAIPVARLETPPVPGTVAALNLEMEQQAKHAVGD